MQTDTIADMLIRIKNASLRKKASVEMPYSKLNESICKVLKNHGFIENYRVFKEKAVSYKSLAVDLAYDTSGKSRFTNIIRVSKSSLRIYSGYRDLRSIMSGLGIYVVSTPKGVMSSKEARKRKLGGEVICKIY